MTDHTPNQALTYAFIFGTHPQLSAAELRAVLRSIGRANDANALTLRQAIGWLETSVELDAAALMERLGGTIKIAQVVGAFDEETIADWLMDRVNTETKFHYGFSLYPIDPGVSTKKYWKPIQALGHALKRAFKEDEISCRFVSSKEVVLSSVIVHKERLLKNGVEIDIFRGTEELLFGYTLAVQPFQAFSKRDYGRPQRDDRSGMLPPKVARMMVNIAEPNADSVILDPFCGSGTVLQEALLMGFTHVVGSDISDKAVADTKENLAWLGTDAARGVPVTICDATQLIRGGVARAASVHSVVFEGYLGSPSPNASKVASMQQELQVLYAKTAIELEKILAPGGRIVAALPFWHYGKERIIKLDIEAILSATSLHMTDTLYYRRPQSTVGRMIVVLERD